MNLAKTPDDVLREVLRRRAAGEPVKAVASDLDISERIVSNAALHLPADEPLRERRRVAALAALDASTDLRDALAAVRAQGITCTIGYMVRLVRARRQAERLASTS